MDIKEKIRKIKESRLSKEEIHFYNILNNLKSVDNKEYFYNSKLIITKNDIDKTLTIFYHRLIGIDGNYYNIGKGDNYKKITEFYKLIDIHTDCDDYQIIWDLNY